MPHADRGIELDPRTRRERPADEIRVLGDVSQGFVESRQGIERAAPREEIAERDVVCGGDWAAARRALVRRDAAPDPWRREEKIREPLGPGSSVPQQVGTARDGAPLERGDAGREPARLRLGVVVHERQDRASGLSRGPVASQSRVPVLDRDPGQ